MQYLLANAYSISLAKLVKTTQEMFEVRILMRACNTFMTVRRRMLSHNEENWDFTRIL
jgi:hypothetical protein